MRPLTVPAGSLIVVSFLLSAGCSGGKMEYESAIDSYYLAHPACLWSQPTRFPMQAVTPPVAAQQGYEALVDAGLLTRPTGVQPLMTISSQTSTSYALTPNGDGAWVEDLNEPGYGNFCYGSRDVTTIDSVTLRTGSSGQTMVHVKYHYRIGGTPSWAYLRKMQAAFPALASDLAGVHADSVSVVRMGDHWEVVKPEDDASPENRKIDVSRSFTLPDT